MQVEEIDLKHQSLVSRSFRSLKTNISDFTFASLYLFRDPCRYRLLRNGDLLIACAMENGEPCWMPLNDPRTIEKHHLIRLMEEYGLLFPVPEEWLKIFSGPEFSVSFREGEMDYLYHIEKMATFRGGRLNRKRNHLKQFLSLYSHESERLSPERIGDAVKVLEDWQAETCLPEGKTDYGPCLEALRLLDRLRLKGIIYYVAGQPAGFLIGEKLNDATFVIHFAKGIKTYKGLYEYMFNDAARRLLSKYAYLNLEEDLGKESLRITKSSYDPDAMVKKYRISLKSRDPRHPSGGEK